MRRRRYLKGKHEAFDAPIYLTEGQREEVMTALKNDVALEKHNLMDYSLLRRPSAACRRVESKRRRRCSRATCTTNRTSSSTVGRC